MEPISRAERIRVVLADGHLGFLAGLAMRLRAEPGLEVVAAATDRQLLHEAVDSSEVDVVLISGRLSDSDGVDVGHELVVAHPDLRLLAMLERADVQRIVAALLAGFAGCILKDHGVEELVVLVRRAYSGHVCVPSTLTDDVLEHLLRQLRSRVQQARRLGALSARETEVLRLMAQGLDRELIGRRLFISPNTVRTHQQRILNKLGVHTSLAAVAIARAADSPEELHHAT